MVLTGHQNENAEAQRKVNASAQAAGKGRDSIVLPGNV